MSLGLSPLSWRLVIGLLGCSFAGTAIADHAVVLHGDGKLVRLAPSGEVTWEMDWPAIHDLHVLPNGNLMVQRGPAEVVEIDPRTKQIVWSYDSSRANGNEGRRVEVHGFQPLGEGRVMIAETGVRRIIEVDRDGKLLKATPLTVDHPDPHSDTRLVRKLANGNYLVAHERDGVIREYDGKTAEVVWDYEVPLFGKERASGHGPDAFGNQAFAAVRLPSGNTLVTTGNGHGVLEVTPDKRIVWQLSQDDLPPIRLAWVTTIEVLKNGHYVIGNCHAGPGQPLLIELDPKTKRVVWTLDRHDDFGNNVSNSQLVNLRIPSIR
ncbi:MAG: hypothetical protein EA381_10145 [Planctomycetaceae bacterium]|nr:MAG: hypothetical protein EA381_10145 [Planctomycetaceae bacterium]